MAAQHGAVSISLYFMPAFFHRHVSVTYGEAYYFDPAYRATVDCAESRYLYDILGRYGVGSPTPMPRASLFIQPIDLLKLTQGATLYCPPDASLETHGHPWAGLSVETITRIDPDEAAHHPVIDRILAQYRELERRYGARADLFGIKSGTMNLHTPYTTAHQLCGEELFLMLVDDPEGVRAIFMKVWDIYRAVFMRLSKELGAPPVKYLQLGDCSAGLLSESIYRESVLPVNCELARQFPECGYHSCGASTHLISAFAELPNCTNMELGPGTDIARAAAAFPHRALSPLIDPVLMLSDSRSRVENVISQLLDATATAMRTCLCAWSFDSATPIGNVEAMYEVVRASGRAG